MMYGGEHTMRTGTTQELDEIWNFIMSSDNPNSNPSSLSEYGGIDEAMNQAKKQRLSTSMSPAESSSLFLPSTEGQAVPSMYGVDSSQNSTSTSSTLGQLPPGGVFHEARLPTILPALVDLEHQIVGIESKVTAIMRNLKQNILESGGMIAQNILDFVESKLKESKAQAEHLRNLLSSILDETNLTGAELIEWDNCCLHSGVLNDCINLELNAVQYCRVADPSHLPPLAALTIVASPLPLATSEEQHLPGPVILCLRVSELAEVKVLADTIINIVYPADAGNSNETSVQHSTPRLYEKDGKLYIHFDRVRIMKPTRLQSVHFKFQTSIAQKEPIHRGEMIHLIESKPTLPIIVMANTGKQWRKAYYKLLEYYVFQEKAIEGCSHNPDYRGVAPVYVSTTRFFNSLQILINSVARHCNYSSHKHANTKSVNEARPASVFNPFCPAELEYLKTSLFEDDLPTDSKKANKAPKAPRGKKRKSSASSEKVKEEDVCKEKVDRKRMLAFWAWFGCSFHNLRDRDKNLPLYVEGKVLFISKEQANDLLVQHPVGTSIIRFSRQKPELFSIAWVAGRRTVRHYLMKEKYCNKNLVSLLRTKPKFNVFNSFLAVDRTIDQQIFSITTFDSPLIKKENPTPEDKEVNCTGYDAALALQTLPQHVSSLSLPQLQQLVLQQQQQQQQGAAPAVPFNGMMWEKIQQHPLWNQLCKDVVNNP